MNLRFLEDELLLGGAAPSPPLASGMTAWLRETATSGDQTAWERMLGTHDGVSNAARAPTAGADSSLAFTAATPDVMAWQSSAANFSTDYLCYYVWAKPTAVATNQTLLSLSNGTAGFGIRCLEVKLISAAFRIDVYFSGGNGRRFTYNAQAAAGTSRLWGFEFNKDFNVDESKRIIGTRGGTVLTPSSVTDLGTGGSPLTLINGTGLILLGNFNDSGVASDAYGGQLGKNVFARAGSPMSGVTEGLLTQTARNALNAFEPLV